MSRRKFRVRFPADHHGVVEGVGVTQGGPCEPYEIAETVGKGCLIIVLPARIGLGEIE
jgi:hypothetical protein